MATKQRCYPFLNGNLCSYAGVELSKDQIDAVYRGQQVITHVWGSDLTWLPQQQQELTLTYVGYGRGRSSVIFFWKDQDGHEYPMFLTDFDDMFVKKSGSTIIHGIFVYQKRGQNYGIKYLRDVDEE